MPIHVGSRADEGIGPYEKTTCVPTVGGDAHIAPPGMMSERSEKTDMPIPVGLRADEGIGPYENRRPLRKNNVRPQRVLPLSEIPILYR